MHDYFGAGEAGQFAFFRIPMALIKNEEFKSVSIDAKLLYGLLLDRMSLSERNGWRDAQGRVFIFYTIKAVCEDLGCCRGKVCRLLDELEKADLIERKRLGQGKPSRIYVKRFASEVRKTDFCNSEKQTSESSENSIPKVGKTDAKRRC